MKRKKNLELSQYLDILGYFLCIILILYFSMRWGSDFFDPLLQNDDTRTSTFPFWAMHDDLFKGDYIAQAMESFNPWLIKVLYYCLTLKIDLLIVTKILQISAIAWGSFHVFQIGRRRAGGLGGLFALYLALHTLEMLYGSAGGLPRSFGMPALLMCMDGIDRNSRIQAGSGTILGFSLYPPAGLIALVTFSLWYLSRELKNKKNLRNIRKEIISISIVTIFCFISLSPMLFSDHKEIGSLYSFEQASSMPEFYMGGRQCVAPLPTLQDAIAKVLRTLAETSDDSPVPYIKHFNDNNKKVVFLLFLFITPILALFQITRFPFTALYLAVVGIILFGIAKLFAFQLYSPDRMIRFSFVCAYLVLMSSSYTVIGGELYRGNMRKIAAFLVCAAFIGFQGITFKGPIGLTVDAHKESHLFQVLQKLPKNTLFAGHPLRMNNIPLWGKRSILISYETSQPWFDKSWERMKQRTYDNFAAYYADKKDPLKVLEQKYGVDYMLIHEDDISSSYISHCKYFKPFTKQLDNLCKKPYEDLIWRKATSGSIEAIASGYMVINLSKFLKELEKVDN